MFEQILDIRVVKSVLFERHLDDVSYGKPNIRESPSSVLDIGVAQIETRVVEKASDAELFQEPVIVCRSARRFKHGYPLCIMLGQDAFP